MKRYYYILVLSIILTAYLFSQTKENEIVKIDTVLKIDSIAVIKVDTIVVVELANEQEEKKEFKQYSGLYGLFSTYDCKKTVIISARIGVGLLAGAFSATLDIPVSFNTNIAAIGAFGRGGMDGGEYSIGFFGLGLGVEPTKTDYFIFKSRTCLGLISYDRNSKHIREPGLNLGIDVLFRFKFIGLSISPDIFLSQEIEWFPLLSVGLNIFY
jgi:hypothetical protein